MSQMHFIILFCCEKANDKEEFSCENSKPCHGSQIMTREAETWHRR